MRAFNSGSSATHQHADPPHPFGLLRARRDWPRRNGTTDCSDEIPPSHASPLNFKTRHAVQNIARRGMAVRGVCGRELRLIVPRCARPLGVKLRRTQYEHMFSALPSNSDIARCNRHFAFVPQPDISLPRMLMELTIPVARCDVSIAHRRFGRCNPRGKLNEDFASGNQRSRISTRERDRSRQS